MSEETKITSTEQQPTDANPADNGGQGEKLFTQDEVNRIVSDRLAREREKLQKPQEDEREAALKAREARLDCREYLNTKNYPEALLDALDTSDMEKFKAAAEKIVAAFPAHKPIFQGWTPGESTRDAHPAPDAFAAAFRPPQN